MCFFYVSFFLLLLCTGGWMVTCLSISGRLIMLAWLAARGGFRKSARVQPPESVHRSGEGVGRANEGSGYLPWSGEGCYSVHVMGEFGYRYGMYYVFFLSVIHVLILRYSVISITRFFFFFLYARRRKTNKKWEKIAFFFIFIFMYVFFCLCVCVVFWLCCFAHTKKRGYIIDAPKMWSAVIFGSWSHILYAPRTRQYVLHHIERAISHCTCSFPTCPTSNNMIVRMLLHTSNTILHVLFFNIFIERAITYCILHCPRCD